MSFRIHKNTRGFTFTELMVAVSVMALMGAAMASLSDPSKKTREQIRVNSYHIANFFSMARATSISSAPVEVSGVEMVPQNGYGIYYKIQSTNQEILFFADTNFVDPSSTPNCANDIITSGDSENYDAFYTTSTATGAGCGTDEVLAEYLFEDDVTNTVEVDGVALENGDEISVLYAPNSGKMTIASHAATPGNFSYHKEVVFKTTIGGDLIKVVTCNRIAGFCDIYTQ